MKIKIDLEKTKEIHGEEIIEIIYANMDIIEKNIELLKELKFDDIEGIFERCPMIFMYFTKDFKKKIDKLVNDLGDNYVEIIQNDISLIEELCN